MFPPSSRADFKERERESKDERENERDVLIYFCQGAEGDCNPGDVSDDNAGVICRG